MFFDPYTIWLYHGNQQPVWRRRAVFFFCLKMFLKCVFSEAMRKWRKYPSCGLQAAGQWRRACGTTSVSALLLKVWTTEEALEVQKKRGKGFLFSPPKFTKINHPVSSAASRKRICICVGYFPGEKWENRTEAQVESIEKAPVGTRFVYNELKSTKIYNVIVFYVFY